MRAIGVALATLATIGASLAPPTGGRGVEERLQAAASANAMALAAERTRAAAGGQRDKPTVQQIGRRPEYRRAAACRDAAGIWIMGGEDGSCPPGIDEALAVDCEAEQVVLPTWRRNPVGPAAWTAWEQVDLGGCGVVLPVLTAEDFRRLPLAPPVLRMQPDRGWVLVNKETIVLTERAEQTLHTTLLGYEVEVVATPERFHYTFGDGSDLWTRSAGHPYPDHDTFRVYEQPGTYEVTLTTEWSGRYRVAGDDTWHPVTGTAQTSTTSPPFEVVERSSRLVADLCTDVPRPDDC